MEARTALIDYVLAHGWDDDDLDELEQALASPTEKSLEEALALHRERHCPAPDYCELVELLLGWFRAS